MRPMADVATSGYTVDDLDWLGNEYALYLLVDLPSTFELHDFSTGDVVTTDGSIDLVVGGHPVRSELP